MTGDLECQESFVVREKNGTFRKQKVPTPPFIDYTSRSLMMTRVNAISTIESLVLSQKTCTTI